jgi:hypothetical protein
MKTRKPSEKPLQKVKLVEYPSDALFLFAVCSTENGYRLSWLLNSSLSLNLQRHDLDRGEFPEFIYDLDVFAEAKNNGALLLPNKIESTKFIAPKYKAFDYLLAIRQTSDVITLETAVKKTPGIVTAVQVTSLDKKIIELVNLF